MFPQCDTSYALDLKQLLRKTSPHCGTAGSISKRSVTPFLKFITLCAAHLRGVSGVLRLDVRLFENEKLQFTYIYIIFFYKIRAVRIKKNG